MILNDSPPPDLFDQLDTVGPHYFPNFQWLDFLQLLQNLILHQSVALEQPCGKTLHNIFVLFMRTLNFGEEPHDIVVRNSSVQQIVNEFVLLVHLV